MTNKKEALNKELENHIPVRISLYNLTIYVISAITVITGSFVAARKFEETQWNLIFGMIMNFVSLPIVLIFTVKSRKKTSNISVLVPNSLQFHQDHLQDDQNIEHEGLEMKSNLQNVRMVLEMVDYEDEI